MPRQHQLEHDQERGADDHEQRPECDRRVEVDCERAVDRERQGLRDALQTAREHDRRAELAEAARERQRLAGREAAASERQHDPEERPPRSGTQGPRSGHQVRVDSLERRNRLPDVERARHKRHRQDDRRLRERDARPEQARAAEEGEQSQPGHCGRQHERQLDERDRKRAPAEAPSREQVGERRPEDHDQRLCDHGGLRADDQRVGHDRVRQLVQQPPRWDAQEDRRYREHEEGERDDSGTQHERAEQRAATIHRLTRGRKP